MRASQWMMASLWILWYHTTQDGYSIGIPACQYCCSDSCGWDSNCRCATNWPVWNWFQISSCRWHSWRSLPLRALWPSRLVFRPPEVLDAHEVGLSVSWTGIGVQNSITGVETIPVVPLQCQESYCAPNSPTLHGYSPTKFTVAALLQLSQSPICTVLPLQPWWKSFQDPFHPPAVLLAYQHLKPISSHWTR